MKVSSCGGGSASVEVEGTEIAYKGSYEVNISVPDTAFMSQPSQFQDKMLVLNLTGAPGDKVVTVELGPSCFKISWRGRVFKNFGGKEVDCEQGGPLL